MTDKIIAVSSPIHTDWNELTKLERRERIQRLQDANEAIQDIAGVQLYPEVYTAGGVYGRSLFIPKGVTLVGEIHKKAQINILLEGRMIIATELEGVKELVAPFTFVSPAGTKRVGTALEDSRWITFLATDKTDDKDVYPEFIAQDFTELDNRLEVEQCHLVYQQQHGQVLQQ